MTDKIPVDRELLCQWESELSQRGVAWHISEKIQELLDAPVQQPDGLKLPDFIRRDVERAIEEAVHPKGMTVHDGIARIGADRLSIILKVIDNPAPADAALVEALELLISTHEEGGWPSAAIVIAKAALAAARVKP